MNFAENTVRYAQISAALSRSRFRSRFRLGLKDRQYICDRGWETMRRHPVASGTARNHRHPI